MPDRIVIVGASLAGLRAAESLRKLGHDGPLTIVGRERHLPYDRPPLSKQVLTGKVEPAETALPVPDDLGADWLLGATASGIDLDQRRVVLADGQELPFDGLVIATGADPRVLESIPQGPGVHYLRTLEDAVALRDELSTASRAVVIGAGFIGLEVAGSAAACGLDVTVLEVLPVALERAVGSVMGGAITRIHERNGVEIRLGVGVAGIERSSRLEGVRISDESVVPADVVVVGVGVVPATRWLQNSGIDLDDGVVCDDRLRVLCGGRPRPDVVAAGDVARWAHAGYGERVRIEHWTNASEQGEAAAQTLLTGEQAAPYTPVPYFWSDQHGLKIQFVGRAKPNDEVVLLEGSPDEGRFVAAYGRDGQLVAALGVRRPARVMALQQAIADGAAFPPDI